MESSFDRRRKEMGGRGDVRVSPKRRWDRVWWMTEEAGFEVR
jgi:hypothetical protein